MLTLGVRGEFYEKVGDLGGAVRPRTEPPARGHRLTEKSIVERCGLTIALTAEDIERWSAVKDAAYEVDPVMECWLTPLHSGDPPRSCSPA
ncbi:hypothetical protein [Streptomyces sp. NPDC004435]|uniref:hypothetical protein n=1 Tax=Streptomyces sp. NPDC004435 TaxID=3364701 RepID=UPI0036B1D1A2